MFLETRALHQVCVHYVYSFQGGRPTAHKPDASPQIPIFGHFWPVSQRPFILDTASEKIAFFPPPSNQKFELLGHGGQKPFVSGKMIHFWSFSPFDPQTDPSPKNWPPGCRIQEKPDFPRHKFFLDF